MAAKNNKKDNYLDYIPRYNEQYSFEADSDGKVTILVENKGFFNLVAQKLFGKPKVTQVHLDEMGNFVWPLIDGKRTVYDIALLVKEAFGHKAEPLYERLSVYMRTLEQYGFIKMERQM